MARSPYAEQRGSSVYFYDENGNKTGDVSCYSSDTFMGYGIMQCSFACIKKGSRLVIYNNIGKEIGSISLSAGDTVEKIDGDTIYLKSGSSTRKYGTNGRSK